MAGPDRTSAGTPVDTLAARLRHAHDRSFVGRRGERELLRAALAEPAPPFAVLFLHGPGGIGKSALVRRLLADSEGARTVVLDGRALGSPAEVLTALGTALGVAPGADPVPALHAGRRTVLAVDTFEQCSALEPWLREDLLPRLPAGMVTVVAGREPPSEAWRVDASWHDLLRVVSLRDLPPDEAGDLLLARGVPQALHEAALAFAGGHPLALSLVADVVSQRGAVGVLPRPGTPDVVRSLLGRFVDEAPSPRHRAALEVCAHARVTTEDLLRAVLDTDDAGAAQLFGWLRARSFVEQSDEGLQPHDLAREILDADLRWRDAERYAAMHGRVRTHVLARAAASDHRGRSRAWRDWLFLHRHNPHFAPFMSWRDGGEYEDVVRPSERRSVLDMTAAAEGPRSRGLVAMWLDRQPDAFRVYRRATEPQPAGFSAWLRLDGADADAVAADPVAAAAWSHACAHGPPRAGEHVGLLRSFVVPGAYHRPSPVMDLVQINACRHWTTDRGLSWSYLAIAEPDFWAPQMAYIDHRAVTEARVGDQRLCLFGHDWRAVPPARWYALMAGRELAHDDPLGLPGAADVAGPVLSAPEFASAVREALRLWGAPEALAASPLCRSRLVTDVAGTTPAGTVLADLLVEATDSLAVDPRDAKLHRAVAVTYFQGAPTQEAAAERLGLPFSTYRRHLASGLARVVDWLWRRELHGPAGT